LAFDLKRANPGSETWRGRYLLPPIKAQFPSRTPRFVGTAAILSTYTEIALDVD